MGQDMKVCVVLFATISYAKSLFTNGFFCIFQVNGRIIKLMGRVSSTMWMVISSKVNGKVIKQTDMVRTFT